MRKLKLFSLLAVLLCAATMWAATGSWTSGVCTVTLTDDGTLTVSGTGAMEDYLNPESVPWRNVKDEITSVIIQEGVTSICRNSFTGCSNLVSLSISSTVTFIGFQAFWMCSNLPSATLPNGLTTIEEAAFHSCSSLTEITIPASVTSIGREAFYDCTAIENVYCYPNAADLYWDDADCDDFQSSRATVCHVKSSQREAYVENFYEYVNVSFEGDLDASTPATPETSDDASGIETAMEALVDAGGTTDLIINRTLYKDGFFNTLCLPFSLTEAELAASPLAGCKLYSLSDASYDGDNLYLTIAEETTIEAGMPYLIKWNYGSNITSMTFTGVTVTASTGSTVEKGSVRFVGTIGRSTLPHGDADYLFLGANDNLYYSDDYDDTSMKGFRAYFIVNSEASTDIPRHAPARLVIAPKMPTAVDQVQGDNVQSTKVIENGQLYLMYKGTRYNVQGKVVK